MTEYKFCDSCKFYEKAKYEEPCVRCRNTSTIGSEEYNKRPFLYELLDAVEHPAHYNQGIYECIDVMQETFGKEATQMFCLLNAFKYIWRNGEKNGVEDVKKARWYLDKYLELED